MKDVSAMQIFQEHTYIAIRQLSEIISVSEKVGIT